MTTLSLVANSGPNRPTVRNYETPQNLERQHRIGYMDGLLCNAYGKRNQLGKTSLLLDLAYEQGYAEGKMQHEKDLLQACQDCGKKVEIRLALVA